MTGLLWTALPMVVFGLLVLLLPAPDPPPRWRAVARRVRDRAAARWARVRPAPQPPAPDPFEVLHLQLRLGVLAEQIRALENDPAVWARGRRLQAAWTAYDGLLRDACRLAGVDVPDSLPLRRPDQVPDDAEWFREEIELTSRGWSW